MSANALQEKFTPYFVGDVVTKWLRHDGDDRLMQLRENFTFVESRDQIWTAPTGFVFDGTTIPRALWTVFGDPFIGDYRRSAVIHDMLCTPYCAQCRSLMIDLRKAMQRYVCPMHPLARPHYRAASSEASVDGAAGCTPHCPECSAQMVDRREASPRYVCAAHPLAAPRYHVSSTEAARTMYVAMRTDGVTERRARVIEKTVATWGPQFEAAG